MISKVKTKWHIAEIHAARNEIIRLNAKWIELIRTDQRGKAARMQARSKRIRAEIKEKYDVILD